MTFPAHRVPNRRFEATLGSLTGFSAPLPRSPALRGISPAQAGATLLISALAGVTVAATGDWKVAAGLVAAGGFTLIGMLRPALFVAMFMLLRPLLDGFDLSSDVPSGNVAGLVGVLLVSVLLVMVVTRRRPTYVPATGRALVAVVLVSLLAVAQARFTLGDATGLEPVAEVLRLLALVAIYLLAANLFDTPAKARNLFLIVVFSAFVPALWGIVELLNDPIAQRNSEVGRISGPFVGPNALGGFLGLAALLLIFLPPEGLPRWVRFAGLAATVVALAATYSRMGWVFLLVGLAVLGWRERKAVVLAGAAVAIALCVAVPAIRERAVPFAVPKDKLEQSDKTYESFDWRINNWRGLLDKWEERPVFGHGLQTTGFVNPRRVTEDRAEASGGFDAHNMVVRILVEGGVVLLLVYIAFFWVMLASVRRLRRRRWPLAEHSRLMYVLWLLVILIGLGTDDPFGFTALMYAMLALTGALEGAYRYWSRYEREPGDRELESPGGGALLAGAGSR